MSKLFVCIGKKATTPYCVEAEHLRVYTIEELCYYICDNADLLDDGFMREGLADFVEQELALATLANELRQMMRYGGALHAFCGLILDHAGYLEKEQRRIIEGRMKENATLPLTERLKKQGDMYAQQKQYYKAQKAYRNLLLREDVRTDNAFMAEVYDSLGKVAVMMFQYKTAAYCFDKSCHFLEQRQVRGRYLLCMRFMMSKSQYMAWLSGHEEFYDLSVDVEREYEAAKEYAQQIMINKYNMAEPEELKEEFCRMVLE
ncbi:MAG: hypothetical protein E7289_07110 [Lachnospiraceae bacterium]|nr:hypothetical protein [Lachnospiraceae bacterium]